MSRIVVKNLPKKIGAQRLQETFSEKGQITDLQLKYNKKGVFRHLAFIGYKTEEEAKAAVEYFHETFIGTSRIKVEISRPFGYDKVKAWSKQGAKEPNSEKLTVDNKKKVTGKRDAQFAEFMHVRASKDSKPSWGDHAVEDDEEEVSDKDEGADANLGDETSHKNMSDMEVIARPVEFTVKIKNLPYSCKKKHLKAFFKPLKLISVRIPPGKKGFAYVGFLTEKDLKIALNKNKEFLEGNMVKVMMYQRKEEPNVSQENFRQGEKPEDAAIIAETGRLFVRNLCFSVTEEELKELFSKHGPIAEVHISRDSHTKQSIGYGFVSFMFAEHAVAAYLALDRTDFQGRLLHVIAGLPKKEFLPDPSELTFKQKKAAKEKTLAHSSHNWNTLFLGPNAVADVMTEQYDVSKADLLSSDTKDSAAVRMALGETQIVIETRKFLLKHGVKLDAFNQPAAERSKTVLVAKNLPAKTSSELLSSIFSKYGTLLNIIFPPSGITALLVFKEPAEAKRAFSKLAFSRIENKPLYLEWAPMDAFSSEPSKENVDLTEKKDENDVFKEQEHEQGEEEGIDIPLENTTLFVKNLSFNTSEESLKKHFKVCGPLQSVSISKKRDSKTGSLLSMGFGFVQYKNRDSAQTALKDLQLSTLDGHSLELKFSNRATLPAKTIKRKSQAVTAHHSTKLCVKNIPFEVTAKEIQNVFEQFGELKFVRLPKKMSTNYHRGFGFVDFVHEHGAKRALEGLSTSTHLLGRRLVLDWADPDEEDIDALRKKTARYLHQSGPERRVKKAKLLEDALLAKPYED